MFDFRYHAISLVAVFLALGIGILLGVTIGDSLVSEADRGLRESLRGDVVEAREERSLASDNVERRDDLIEEALPTLAGGRIAGERVAVIGVGGLPDGMVASVREAVDVGGGELGSVSSFPVPPVTEELAEAVGGRFETADEDPPLASALGRRVARAILDGDRLAARLADELPDQFEGDFQGATAVVFHRAPADPPSADAEAFESAMLDALAASDARTVGVEESDTDPSQVSFYSTRGLPSIDNVETPGGRVALVLALDGADGAFGFKDTADEPLPDPPPAPADAGRGGGRR